MAENPFVGTWRLVSFESRAADGEVTYPCGSDASGYIMYSADGYTCVEIMGSHRVPFASGDIMKGSAEERAGAAERYIAYAGRYDVHDRSIVVHVEVSFFPNWVGTDQVRNFELNGNQLSLSTNPLLLAGKQRTSHLIWERV